MPDRRTRRKGRKGGRHRGGSIAATLRMPFVSSPAAGPVGYSFQGGEIETWPGMVGNEAGITMSNHYPYNTNVVDPPLSSSNTQCVRARCITEARSASLGQSAEARDAAAVVVSPMVSARRVASAVLSPSDRRELVIDSMEGSPPMIWSTTGAIKYMT